MTDESTPLFSDESQREYIEMIAKVCYEAVRSYYHIRGNNGIDKWSSVPKNVKNNAINRVIFFLKNPDEKSWIDDNSLEKENVSKMFRAICRAFTQ